MVMVFILGTAGSGKSLLTEAYSRYLKMAKQNVAVVNLDPGALTLPYAPDVDVRNYIDIIDLMKEYGLGPNGALIMAADLIAEKIERIIEEVKELNADIFLVDTSGQMELFAFRESGLYIANELTKEPKAIAYLVDAVFSANPLNFVSNLFLSASIYNRFYLPQVHLLSKCDLLPRDMIDTMKNWASDQSYLEAAIDQELKGTRRLLSRSMMEAIYQLGLNFLLIPVSSRTNEGLINLNMALEIILTGGEKYTV